MKKKFLCIAEKPSVSKELEAVYKKHGHPQYDIDFAAFHGHLMRLPDAEYYDEKYKKWNLDDLPILPTFKYIEEDKKSCRALVDRIKKGGYDGLINACDAGREGELIFYSFYEGEKLSLPVLRFWASDVTEETLTKALQNLVDSQRYEGLREASKLRAEFDWLVGINLSRAATLKSGTKVPIGRVQSPTLKLIVDRELEIRNFVPQDFYEIKARFKTDAGEAYDGTLLREPDYKNTRFDKKEEAEAKVATIAKTAVVLDVQQTRQTTKAPSLYSLVELQKDASKYFGFRADKTLNIAQSLYETHKILSYPRTESRFLPTAMANEIWDHLMPIKGVPELKEYVAKLDSARVDSIMKSKSYVDNAKITDHHAIIPTKESVASVWGNLSEDEKKLFTLVCKRLIAIFMDPYVVLKTSLTTESADGSRFTTSGKVVQQKGFSVLYSSNAKDTILPAVKKGDKLSVAKTGIVEKQTKPPMRYNTETLLTAMQNVGKKLTSEQLRKVLRDTAGLGTSATRAEILKKLETHNYVTIQRQCFVPTDFGIAVCQNFEQRGAFSAELTAVWEDKLKKVENSELSVTDFRSQMKDYVISETKEASATDCNLRMLSYPIVGKCPLCGETMRSYKDYFVCEQYKKKDKPCTGCFKKDFFGHRITDAEMRGILKGKPTKEYELKSPRGKSWKSAIAFVPERGCLGIANSKESSHENINEKDFAEKNKISSCPNCGGTIYKAKNYYLCSNKNEKQCPFICSINICGYEVTPEDIKETVENGQTKKKRNFIWKSGKKGTAYLALEGGKVGFKF